MFSFGIFTTHLPYIAFVVFYAYFLIFGVEKAQDGKIQISEHSVQIKHHVNSFQRSATSIHYFDELSQLSVLKQIRLNHFIAVQKWKWYDKQTFSHFQEHFLEFPFCRPPPEVA